VAEELPDQLVDEEDQVLHEVELEQKEASLGGLEQVPEQLIHSLLEAA